MNYIPIIVMMVVETHKGVKTKKPKLKIMKEEHLDDSM